MERLIATTDFTIRHDVEAIQTAFHGLIEMLHGHAQYENETLHALLKAKNSTVYQHVEADHEHYIKQLDDLDKRLNKVIESNITEEQIELGYQFYLWYRKFAGDNLLHLHEEETVILPELQRLYGDDFLSQVEFGSYRVMSPEDLIHMTMALFPHMNPSDREVFLRDIKACDATKIIPVWNKIQSIFPPEERLSLARKLGLPDHA